MSNEPIHKYLIIVQAVAFGIVLALGVVSLYKIGHDSTNEALGEALRVFTVTQGGTGTSTIPSTGNILVGLSDGTYAPRATSTLGIVASGDGMSNWLYNGSRLSPSTTVGIGVFASSTIGNGTGAGGLTIDGTATSTNLVVKNLTSALTLTDGKGLFAEYAGTTCTNQFVRILSALGVATCATVDISADTNLSADGTEIILTGDALSLGTALTFTTGTSTTSFFSGLGTFTNMVVTTLATFLNATFTGLVDIGGGVLEIPNGSAPTVDAIGELALDSTSNQLVLYGSAKKVIGDGNLYPAFTYATSTAWTGTTTIPLGTAYTAETWNGVQCFTDTGTVNVDFGDGTNFMNATTSKALNPAPIHTLSSNNTFTAGETRYARVGTPVSTPTKISCTVSKSLTSD